jgi:hypothetical protein
MLLVVTVQSTKKKFIDTNFDVTDVSDRYPMKKKKKQDQ